MQHGRYLVPYIHIIRITRCALLQPQVTLDILRLSPEQFAATSYGINVIAPVPKELLFCEPIWSKRTKVPLRGPKQFSPLRPRRSPEEDEAAKGAQQLTPPTSTPLPRERKRPREKIRERMADE
ncbi:unnamed protein product [Musa acuminata var. zebrina]